MIDLQDLLRNNCIESSNTAGDNMEVDGLRCPNPECNESLKRNRKGKYPKHCPDCDAEIPQEPEKTAASKQNPQSEPITKAAVASEAALPEQSVVGGADINDTQVTQQTELSPDVEPSDPVPEKEELGTAQSAQSEPDVKKSKLADDQQPSPVSNTDTAVSVVKDATAEATQLMPQREIVACPVCAKDRKRNKKGLLARFCQSCKYDFNAVLVAEDGPSIVPLPTPGSSFVSEYIDPNVKDDPMAQSVDSTSLGGLELHSQHFGNNSLPGPSGDADSLTRSFVIIPSLGADESMMMEDDQPSDKTKKRQADCMSDGDAADCKPKVKTLKTPEKEMADMSLNSETKEDVQMQRSSSATVTRQLFPTRPATSDPHSEDVDEKLEEEDSSSEEYASCESGTSDVTLPTDLSHQAETVVSGGHKTRLEIRGSESHPDTEDDSLTTPKADHTLDPAPFGKGSLVPYLPNAEEEPEVNSSVSTTTEDTPDPNIHHPQKENEDNSLSLYLPEEEQLSKAPHTVDRTQDPYKPRSMPQAAQPSPLPRARKPLSTRAPGNCSGEYKRNTQLADDQSITSGDTEASTSMKLEDQSDSNTEDKPVAPQENSPEQGTFEGHENRSGSNPDDLEGTDQGQSKTETHTGGETDGEDNSKVVSGTSDSTNVTEEAQDQGGSSASEQAATSTDRSGGAADRNEPMDETRNAIDPALEATEETVGNDLTQTEGTLSATMQSALSKENNPQGNLFGRSQPNQQAYPGIQVSGDDGGVASRTRSQVQANEAKEGTSKGQELIDPSDEEIVVTFMDFCEKLEDSKKCMKDDKKHKISNQEEDDLDKVVKEGRGIRASYTGNVNSQKNKDSSSTQQLQATESINRMRKHINKYAKDMNRLLHKLNIEPFYRDEVPSSRNKDKVQNQRQKRNVPAEQSITFRVVLSEIIKQRFKDLGKEPIVELRGGGSFTPSSWPVLTTLERNNEYQWSGVWKTSMTDTRFRYKYYINEEGAAAVDAYEWLGTYGYTNSILDRYLNLSKLKEDTVIYDGIVLMKEESSIWKKAGVKMFGAKDSKNEERLRGVSEMLPDFVAQLMSGTSLSDLIKEIGAIGERQLEHLSGFSSFIHYNRRKRTGYEICLQAFDTFTNRCISDHNMLIQGCNDVNLIANSLLGILWLSSRKWDDVSFLRANVNNVAQCLVKTMKVLKPLLAQQRFIFDDCITGESRTALQNALMYCIRVLEDVEQRSWILLIPLIHILNKSMDAKTDNWNTEEWWGTAEIKTQVQNYKRGGYKDLTWRELYNNLSPFFTMDELLPYTFLGLLQEAQLIDLLFSLHNKDVMTLPISGVLGCVEYHLKTSIDKDKTESMLTRLKDYLLTRRKETGFFGAMESDRCLEMCGRIIGLVLPAYPRYIQDAAIDTIHIYLMVLEDMVSSGSTKAVKELGWKLTLDYLERIPQHYNNNPLYSDRWNPVKHRVCVTLAVSSFEIKHWEALFLSPVENNDVRSWWLSSCQKLLAARLNKIASNWPNTVVELYCNTDIKEPHMDQTVADAAFPVAEELLRGGSTAHLNSALPDRVGKLVDQALNKAWKVENKEDMEIVKNMLVWGNFISVWKFYRGLSDEQKRYISPENEERLVKSRTALETVFKRLIDGNLSFTDFDFFDGAMESALALCEVSDELQSRTRAVQEAFNIRRQERDRFNDFYNSLASLWNFCKTVVLAAEREAVETWLDCQPTDRVFCDIFKHPSEEVICEPIPQCVRAMLNDVKTDIKKVIFFRIFDHEIKTAQPGEFSNVATIYERAKSKYQRICEKYEQGTVNIEELEQHRHMYFNGNEEHLLEELESMLPTKALFTERSKQIRLCSNLGQFQDGAKVILELKELFKLTGDFSDMENIMASGNKQLQLKNISEKMVESAARIQNIGDREVECLKAFVESKELIEWIKKEVPKKDISNFVDLASSTLGEDDQAALKTRFLLNALTGYSPLIYDLEVGGDEPTDYNKFVEICRKVWDAMKTNPELVLNLRSSNREVDWLKQVKNHFGGVEMKSIAQATTINENGLYYVGNIENYSEKFKSLEDVIRLSVKIKVDGGEKTKSYSYSDLKDLQSKLTLVAGDKQKENRETIRRFDTMRDTVENLARAYLDIRREGCIQFDDMMVVVHCKEDHKIGIEVRLRSIAWTMMGKNSATKDAIEHCNDLHRYMTDCIYKWRESMNGKRSEYPELNFYTTEQLVVLRKELGTFLEDQTSQTIPQALPLLAMIVPVYPGQLLQFINSYDPRGKNQGDDAEEVMETGDTFLTYDKMTADQKELVDEVQEEHEDFTELLAVQAINELGEDAELENMIEWIEKYKLEQRQIQAEEARKAKLDSESALQTSSDLLRKIKDSQPTGASLQEKLNKLWEQFIEHTSHSIKNFLGIPHLGHVLDQIQKLRETPERERRIPDWLKRGSPCLIPTPQADIYKTVLSVYECDPDAAFPTRNEVLICNKKTTVEEVRLFLTRALNDPISFYCMVNCHLLGYDVCRSIETRLSNKADDKIKTYGLAFFYAQEKRDARIRAYLDKHSAKNVKPSSAAKLRKYVQQILTLPNHVKLSACSVDPNRSCSRLIRSERAGVGKSLNKFNLCNQVRSNKKLKGKDITIPIYKTIDADSIIARLNAELGNGYTDNPCHTIHIDIAHEVDTGADELLFNLCILRSIVNSEGVVWQSQHQQYYIIECMPHTRQETVNGKAMKRSIHEVMDHLPTTWCITPTEALDIYSTGNVPANFNGFDKNVFGERQWQIVIKFLDCKRRNDRLFRKADGLFPDPRAALDLLISNCGLQDPTWSELRHYVYFLSNQLNKVEHSPYCGQALSEDLPGFRAFVVDFMFRMAKDFATRSLKIAEETPGLNLKEVEEEGDANILDQLTMKRTWESGNHPYLFFNEDGETFSPLGFFVVNQGGANTNLSLIDCQTRAVLVPNCMSAALKATLDRYHVPMSEDFNSLTRPAQLTKLRNVMVKTIKLSREVAGPDGALQRVEEPMFVDHDDPDPNYVLTMDNAKKILAIHQRLRVEIPVIIMGETGCGKTKLIDFMSKLQVPTALKDDIDTMVIVKIHGGTTEEDIIQKVHEAQDLALQNQEKCREYAAEFESSQVPKVYTILFLDEANTTEAIGLVKEILCDGRIRGSPLRTNTGLKIIAACNPYRRHSPEMIEKLKKAGLGYNVGEDETKDKFGQIPMRHLVYRVQALSQSLLPLVWDFGTLKSKTDDGVDVECAYIRQMIIKFNQTSGDDGLNFAHNTARVAELLTMTQSFMREQKDECSFVSLRDVQRLLDVANWFYRQRRHIFPAVDMTDDHVVIIADEEDDEPEEAEAFGQKDYTTRSLILAIGVCYLARLEDDTRDAYAAHIGGKLEELIGVEDVDGKEYLEDQIERCQNMFIREVIDKEQHLNIATNKALKENVFMMIICIENRIPLFVVGKPGSSKSLSKSMVIDAMKGNSSKKDLFKRMKQTYMVSFQCSRHATPAGIVGVFKHCANFQKGQDMDKFVSVVVLDEVGLAEDSENMPLKTLHPLLEDGCEGNKKPEPYMKCAFVGISNWALDPAKMNRGIFVQRGTPNPEELTQIATEICKSSRRGDDGVGPFIDPLAKGYLAICKAKKPEERDLTEFFGLRDFYSLMKMVVNFADKTGQLNRNQLEHSIRRNFGGFNPESGFDPMDIFSQHCPTLGTLDEQEDGRPPIDSIGLIQSSLSGEDTALKGMESRYLLILTENLSVLSIILNEFKKHEQQPEVVFGSKFREDVSYTQVCHNIFRIKMCMDMGKPVILLNLDDLYESLYDALNQYFSTWGERKFVDLGLGTHRVKTFVNEKFRLVVIADKNKVHSEFPIPLINRLEKHYVSATSLLTDGQKTVKHDLEEWTKSFVKPKRVYQQMCPSQCDFCQERLDKPYQLPCRRHYVGPCCMERIQEALTRRQETIVAIQQQGLQDEEQEQAIAELDKVKCDIEGCDTEIDVDHEWLIDTKSLENRQYFENSTRETAFIGYSTETTALAVRQATEDVQNSEDMRIDDDQLPWQQILERAQYYMLLCSTGEAVMRLDRTDLDRDAKRLQEIYLHEQYHETLLQYLENELYHSGDQSLFIQVTSFAELMSTRDVDTLTENLNTHDPHQLDIFNIYLKDFAKEDQFTDTIRSFYTKESDHAAKLLLVQCEAADENTELLDSVRFIVQRESEVAEGVTHTVLLLNLPRGRAFTGYQGGKWSCVHIDDPRSPEIRLPSLSKCMELTPSQIIAKLLPRHTDPAEEIEQEADSDDEMRDERPGQVDSDSERPGQAGSDDEMRDERPGQVDSDSERPGQADSDDEMREHAAAPAPAAAADSDDDMQVEKEGDTAGDVDMDTEPVEPEAGQDTEVEQTTEQTTEQTLEHTKEQQTAEQTTAAHEDMEMGDEEDDDMPPLEEDEDMPPLEGDEEKIIIPEDEYPDTELETYDQAEIPDRRPVPQPRAQPHAPPRAPLTPRHVPPPHRQRRDNDDDELMFADLLKFVQQCLQPALSIIMTDSQYDRATIITKLLELNQEFRHIFLRQVHHLLERQEEYSAVHWVKADAAKASNMKQSETMRHALEDSLERAFVPALAAVIAFIDVRENLTVMDRQGPFSNMWLQIFDKCDKLGLDVKLQNNKLPKSFKIHQAGEGSQSYRTQFPFSWLAKSTIDNLIKAARVPGISLIELAETVSGQFKTQTPIGRVVYDDQYKRLHGGQLLDNYIKDFVYLTHPCTSTYEHQIVGVSIMKFLDQNGIKAPNVVHIHLAYEELKAVFSNLSVILSLTWKEEDGSDLGKRVKTDVMNLTKQQRDDNLGCDLVALHSLLLYLSEIKVSDLLTNPELWCDRVENSKHIVSRVLDHQTAGELDDVDNVENPFTVQCRVLWWKLMLKKLYVEHVIIPTRRDVKGKRKPFKLSFFIKKVTGSSFQDYETFTQVVDWLRETVIEGVQNLYPRCPTKCPICDQLLDSPIKLPCGHMICDSCVDEVKLCPTGGCATVIPDRYTYNPAADDQMDERKLDELKWLRKRLNKFFMAFVAEVIFGADTEPDHGILQWLLDCITFKQGTREFSLYNTADVVDPTPVLRSFLLKLLLQCTQQDAVQTHLDRMIAEWTQDIQKKMQTFVLLMDCRKDFYMPQVALDYVNFTDDDIDLITDGVDVLSMDVLQSTAELQCILGYGLSALDLSLPQQSTEQLEITEAIIRRFLLATTERGNPQPGYYLTRQLLVSRGESFIKDLINTPHNYLIPEDVKRDLESFTVPDVLSVYGGQQYRAAKTAIDEVIAQSNNADAFTNAVNQLKLACNSHWLLIEVIFTRITRTFVQRTPVPQNVTNGLWEQLNTQLQGKHRDILGMLLRDGALPPEMDVNTARGINLSMLVLNLLDCMCNNQPMSDLNPLSELINQPMEAAHHFLPTMMDNQYELHAEEIRRALQQPNENPVAYACPNGHPYYIGNCGRPASTAVCIDCGQPIGGQQYVAANGNRPLDANDGNQKTRPGHILGAPEQRTAPIAERDLSVLSVSVLRCLTHLCMYTGAIFNPQQVSAMIDPAPTGDVLAFLAAHIERDMQQISQCSGHSVDDSVLLLHELIHRIKQAARQGGNVALQNIQQRKAWEAQFDNRYIKPTFSNNTAQRIQNIKQQLVTADSVDLRRILSTVGKPINEENILASPGLWEFKQNLTLPRVENILATHPPQDYPTLRHVVRDCDSLMAVRYLPDVLELMRVFGDKFHSRFKREEASRLQIGQFCQNHGDDMSDIRRLVDSFISAWNIMSSRLNAADDRQYEELDITSPLSCFLLDQHSKRGGQNKNSPPFTLIIYLIDTQNNMVADARPQKIPLTSINSSNVITVESGDEVIGVILSHSEYEMRETTTVRYNWRAVEREIVMRYKNNKPILDFTVDQLQYYVFQEDFNLHNQLKSISDSQEWLSPDLQVSITSKLLPRVPTLTAHLKKLQVAINFLYGTKIEGDNSLADYMTAFAPDLSYLPNTIKLKHVRDVWLLLKYTQTDLLMRQHQEPFDDIDTECRDTLPHNLQNLLADCTMYNSPRTKLLLQEMFKYIILRLNKAAASEGDLAEKTEASLDDALRVFIQYGANTDQDDNRGHQILEELPDLPAELLVKHTPKAWSFIWTRFTTQVE